MLIFVFYIPFIPLVNADTYTYDANNRLTSVTNEDGSTIYYTYDASGNITSRKTIKNPSPADKPVPQIKFTIGKDQTPADKEGVMVNNRALVPLRDLVSALSATVSWDDSIKKATVTKGDKTIEMVIGNTSITINGIKKPIDSSPIIINSRVYLPARYVAEALGYSTSWDSSTQSIIISANP